MMSGAGDLPGRTGEEGRRGITLVELLVVLILLSLLLAIGATLFRNPNRDLGVRVAAGHLMATIRSVREHARSEGMGAAVRIDLRDPQRFQAVTGETVQMWHFESLQNRETPGAFGSSAKCSSKVRRVAGRVGSALQFDGTGVVECGSLPVQRTDQGLVIDFWILPQSVRGTQTICRVTGLIEVRLEGDGRLTASLGSCRLGMPETPRRMLLEPDLWYHVQLMHQGGEGQLWVNEQAVDARPGALEWNRSMSLQIGASERGLVGAVDEFRVGVILAREEFVLAREVRFEPSTGSWPRNQSELWIHFDAEGRLDARRHPRPVDFFVRSPSEGERIRIESDGAARREPDVVDRRQDPGNPANPYGSP